MATRHITTGSSGRKTAAQSDAVSPLERETMPPKTYGELGLIMAYVDSRRPPYPHEDFGTFRRARLTALEKALGVHLSGEHLPDVRARCIWMLFERTVSSLVSLDPQGYSDDSLLNTAIDERDTPQLNIRRIQEDLFTLLEEYRKRHVDLLVSLFRCLWGPLERSVTAIDLVEFGFDDSKEPQISDYFDYI